MRVSFFNTSCSEQPRTDHVFGLCDDDNEAPAYADVTNVDRWIAKVENEHQHPVVFTAVDHCIEARRPETNDDESLCDCMLTSGDQLYLVELKDRRSRWKAKAMNQLENTIRLLTENENLESYRYKKGFACNKDSPGFAQIDHELKKRVFHQYKFRLDVQATIPIR